MMTAPKTLADLQRIVDEHIEEGTRIEFKRQLPQSGKNEDIKKDVSAFANSVGGVIIYGIEEDGNRRANALTPFETRGRSRSSQSSR